MVVHEQEKEQRGEKEGARRLDRMAKEGDAKDSARGVAVLSLRKPETRGMAYSPTGLKHGEKMPGPMSTKPRLVRGPRTCVPCCRDLVIHQAGETESYRIPSHQYTWETSQGGVNLQTLHPTARVEGWSIGLLVETTAD